MSDSETDSDSCFTFGEGIEYVLDQISFPPNARQPFSHDAQVITNAVVRAVSRFDPMFRKTFGGLSLGGSCLDRIKIDLPEEFDMHMKIHLAFQLHPELVPNRPGFIFLRASSRDHPCVQHFPNEGNFISRVAVQNWLRNSLTAIIPQLQGIRCTRRRVYSVAYTAHGYGVAHTLLATEHTDASRQISFDFVPVFEFAVDQWPAGLQRPRHNARSWFAVPRKYFDKRQQQDVRSFMLCAPHWERLVLHKKQNLKDSLRLMKALRNANGMPALLSYFIKSVYLHAVEKKSVNWNQAPGRILIRMLINLLHCLLENRLPFFLAPDHNCLDQMRPSARREYIQIVSRNLGKLIRRRDADYLTDDDLFDIFGVE